MTIFLIAMKKTTVFAAFVVAGLVSGCASNPSALDLAKEQARLEAELE